VVGIASGVTTAVVAAEHAETRKAYNAADALAQAERERANEAERRFRQSKALGDLVFRVSEEEIGWDSPSQGPRRRLLLAALQTYRDLLASGHDDPEVRAELDRLLARVERLLAEQSEMREAEATFLLGTPAVRGELELTPEQAEARGRVVARTGPGGPGLEPKGSGPKGPGPKGPGGPGPEPRGPGMGPDPRRAMADPAVRLELIRLLTTPQRQRLRQIFLQYLGPMAFNDPEVVERLGLTS